ncbi:MAG TPA: flagellar export chaperone FliS [Patescibacteria group bacterium]|nr:flagellar export chaperone FliS [Patescibacteria group bacterium]
MMANPLDAYRKAAALGGAKKILKADDSVSATGTNPSISAGTQTGETAAVIVPETAGPLAKPVAAPSSAQGRTEAAVTAVGAEKLPFVPAYQEKDQEPEEEKPLNPYFVNSVMTASPEKLTLMLYDGALRFMNDAVRHIEEGKIDKAHKANTRTQDIFVELMSTLNMSYEISNNLMQLYSFVLDSLIQANVKKDAKILQDMIGLTQEFRNTWAEAMKIAGAEKNAGNPDLMLDAK